MKDCTRRRLGSIRELPSGRYFARIQQGYKVDGKPRVIFSTFDTRAEAETWLVAKSVELGRRPDLDAGVTVRVLWAAYEADRRGKLANSTLDRYKGCMVRVILPSMGDIDASRVTVAATQELLDSIHGRSEAKQCKSALSSVLTWAVRNGILAENPIRSASFAYPGDEGHEWEDESIWDADPFAAIEGSRDVWGAKTVMQAFPKMRGIPLEPVWLAMVGGGLRMEEAFALRGMDVRRVEINGQLVTQVAVHHAENWQDGRHRTKNRRSVRIVAMLEPFGERLWEIAGTRRRDESLCDVSPANQSRGWRKLFERPSMSKHMPKKTGFVHKGALFDHDAPIPYIPLSRMRATHETLMQEAGVLDSINAAMHGHSQQVSYSNYQRGDVTDAARQASEYLMVVS